MSVANITTYSLIALLPYSLKKEKNMIKIGTALFEACEELERERGISKEVLIASLCDAMVAAYKKHMHVKEAANIEAILDEQTGEIGVFSTKTVVEEV